MAYNPGIQYRGDQHLAAGIASFGDSLGEGLNKRGASKGMRKALVALELVDKDDAEDMGYNELAAFSQQSAALLGAPQRKNQNALGGLAVKGAERDEDQAVAIEEATKEVFSLTDDPEAQKAVIAKWAPSIGLTNATALAKAPFEFSNNEQGQKFLGAQIDSMTAASAASQAETIKAWSEMLDSQNGVGPAEKEMAEALRKETLAHPAVKEYFASQAAVSTLQSYFDNPTRTGADDIGSIFIFMKALDPQSAVRSGEFDQASASAGSLQTMFNRVKNITDGTVLSEGQVSDLLESAKKASQGKAAGANMVRDEMIGQAEEFGIARNLAARAFPFGEDPTEAPTQATPDPIAKGGSGENPFQSRAAAAAFFEDNKTNIKAGYQIHFRKPDGTVSVITYKGPTK